ncbi:hypothetical protein [Bacillus altitudinis]|uniref:hypothetical protein n=1 Tax=Bacillus altitudinis TaxID=293387 RepID=UPI00345A97A9
MNGRGQAEDKILEFLESEESEAILTGNHYHQKFPMVFDLIQKNFKDVKVLLRTMDKNILKRSNISCLENRNFVIGQRFCCGENVFVLDTIRMKCRDVYAEGIDIALIYPIKGHVENEVMRKAIFQELNEIGAVEKIIYITDLEDIDTSWAADLKYKIVYDSN